jgi:hypothetical protein
VQRCLVRDRLALVQAPEPRVRVLVELLQGGGTDSEPPGVASIRRP